MAHSEEYDTLQEVLAHVSYGGLHAMSISLEPPGRLVDANVEQIMRAIGAAEKICADVTWRGHLDALLPGFSPYVRTFEMNVGYGALDSDTSLNLLLYFADRTLVENIVIKRYHADELKFPTQLAKVTNNLIASFFQALRLWLLLLLPRAGSFLQSQKT